jgi:hypothetical protein
MKMDVDSGGGATKRSSTVMKYQSTAANLRMEFVQTTGKANAIEGTAMIMRDADTTMMMILPPQHTATIMSMAGMLGGGLGLQGITHHFTRNDLEDLGAGERILGHATHHYRMTVAGTLDMTIGGQTCQQPLDGTTDVWTAPDVDIASVMTSMASHYQQSGMLDQIMQQQMNEKSKVPKGALLRSISRSTKTDAQGNPITVTTSMDMLELTHGLIDSSNFAAPADYRIMDMRKMMAKLPRGMLDSAKAAGATHAIDGLCGAGKAR